MHGRLVEGGQELRAVLERLRRFRIGAPLAIPLVCFGPLVFHLVDGRLEKVIEGLGGFLCQLRGAALLLDAAQVVGDFANDAGLFPGFAAGGILSSGLVRLPAALGENPGVVSCRLD